MLLIFYKYSRSESGIFGNQIKIFDLDCQFSDLLFKAEGKIKVIDNKSIYETYRRIAKFIAINIGS